MRMRDLLIKAATILSLTAAPALAAPKTAPAKPGAPKPASTHGGPKTTASPTPTTTATTHGSPKVTSGSPKVSPGSTKTASSSSPKTVAAHGSAKKNAPTTTTPSSSSTTSTGTTSTTTTSGTTTSGTTTTTTPQLNPIAQKISSKPQLNSKITAMLPTGMTLNQASNGFKNQGQFLAALHVSQNLAIPFADLKSAMTGIKPVTTTGGTTTGGTNTTTTQTTALLSLGQAIHKLRPRADASGAESTATRQATTDLGGR